MGLSVIIVNWNGLRYLQECLDSLVLQLPPDAELIVVDNGSTDGSVDFLQHYQPALTLVLLPQNLGFAGGVNAGFRVANGDLLFLLNNDAFVEPNCVSELLAAAEQYPQVGSFGAVLTFAHRPDIVASAGIRVRRDGLALDLWAGRHVDQLPINTQEIFGASGGAVIYRRALLDDVGLLEPDFFAYLEDVDIAWRAQLRGWSSMLVPTARARHVYSATSGQGSPFKQRLLGRNRVRTIVRGMPTPLLRQCAPQILLYDVMAIAYGLLKRQSAIIAGRWEALCELPRLLQQRKRIQQNRLVQSEQLARWLEPVGLPWQSLREQQQLEAILAERPSSDETQRKTS